MYYIFDVLVIVTFALIAVPFLASGENEQHHHHQQQQQQQQIHVKIIACVGDSLTFGFLSSDRLNKAYPAVLSAMPQFKNSGYVFENYGDNGRTAMKIADRGWTYFSSDAYKKALKSNPTAVIIMLGTNDAKAHYNETSFRADYLSLIRTFQTLSPPPRFVWICIPPPVLIDQAYGIQMHLIMEALPRIIPEIAAAANVPVINNHNLLINKTEAFLIKKSVAMGRRPNDGVHLSDVGNAMIADNVAKAIAPMLLNT